MHDTRSGQRKTEEAEADGMRDGQTEKKEGRRTVSRTGTERNDRQAGGSQETDMEYLMEVRQWRVQRSGAVTSAV